jgi:chloramphenicol-sensitive protein RarD
MGPYCGSRFLVRGSRFRFAVRGSVFMVCRSGFMVRPTVCRSARGRLPGIRSTVNRGVLYALGAYGLWGLFPLYWKLFHSIGAMQILGHRIIWSFVVLLLLVAGLHRDRGLWRRVVSSGRLLVLYAAAAVLIGFNWYLYIWAVNAGLVVETSLGYFINPLVNVLLGVAVFRERLRPAQWGAVALAGAGVLHLTFSYGAVPWIALGLAFSFGGYGVAKKNGPLAAVPGLTVETAVLVAPALVLLVALHHGGEGVFFVRGAWTAALLATSGLVTVVPLLFFAAAVQRVPLSVLGILQYIAPTIQLLLGVLVFREPFSGTQLAGFSLVWLALAVFTLDAVRRPASPSC